MTLLVPGAAAAAAVATSLGFAGAAGGAAAAATSLGFAGAAAVSPGVKP
ncbi:hypothetical protein [Dactylosporangium darangshiense]